MGQRAWQRRADVAPNSYPAAIGVWLVSEPLPILGRDQVLRGESSPVRRSGIRMRRCTVWRGVKTPPSAPLEVAEADLLLEVLTIALDAPAQLGEIDDARERDVVRQCRKPVLRRLALARRPLNQQPFFRPRFGQQIIPMRDANAHARKPRGQPHSAPSARREPTRERLDPSSTVRARRRGISY